MDRRAFLLAGSTAAVAAGPAVAAAERRRRPAIRPGAEQYAPAVRAVAHYAAQHLRDWALPGLTVLLADQDGLVAQMQLGWADVDRRIPMGPRHKVQIGSISKSFTAMAIHQLAQEGKLSLQDDVRKHLVGIALPAEPAITITHLLSHSSGLAEDPPLFPRNPDGKLWLGFAPGTAWSYSNLGFTLLGMIVERHDGRPLAQSLKARIFEPLGMHETVGVLLARDRDAFATGYSQTDPEADWTPKTEISAGPALDFIDGAGCVGSTAEDMALWMRYLIGAGRGHGGPLLSDAHAAAYAKPIIAAPGWAFKGSSYGSGIAYVPLEGHQVMQHTGGMTTFHSSFHADPLSGVACFASTNSGAGDYRPRDLTAFGCAMMRAAAEPQAGLDPKPAPTAFKPPPAKPALDIAGADPALAALAGRYQSIDAGFGSVIIVAAREGLFLSGGGPLERAPEGHWRIKGQPDLERLWFMDEMDGRPQTLCVSGDLARRADI
jgi:CubicO group peptidase (beta-lactamase class C family)